MTVFSRRAAAVSNGVLGSWLEFAKLASCAMLTFFGCWCHLRSKAVDALRC